MRTEAPRAGYPEDGSVATRSEEVAGADEVAALGVLVAHVGHVPGQRLDDDESDDEELLDSDLGGVESDLSAETKVVPRQADEFTCGRCFLVAHVSQRAPGSDCCRDCS